MTPDQADTVIGILMLGIVAVLLLYAWLCWDEGGREE